MPYTPSDRLQFQAGALKKGKFKLEPADQELMDWVSLQFNIRALDFLCERRDGPKNLPQQVVHIALETADQVKGMQANHTGTALIVERFLRYFKSRDSETKDLLKIDAFPSNTNPYPEIIITYRPLNELSREILEEMMKNERQEVLSTFESVWTISQQVIFFCTDAQVKENMANGTSAKIIAQLEELDNKYDIKQSYPYNFDSKESFDRDYESNWYYYWK